MNEKRLVLGIGNILLRDEGVGVHVVEAMQTMTLPDDVEALDGGTSGADLIEVIADRPKLIVVDAAQVDGNPGDIYRFTEAELTELAGGGISLHELGMLETLRMARQLKCAPAEVVIFGIKPKDISPGLEMTAEIQARVPKMIELVLRELGGVTT